MECYSAMKRNEIMPFAATLDGPRDYHTKWRKRDRKTNIWYHFYVESKKNATNKLMVTKGERESEG